MTCAGALIDVDGETCVRCHRRVRFEEAYGKVVHVRGRVKGQPYKVGRWKSDAAPTARIAATAAAVAPAPVLPVRSSEPPRALQRPECPDCGAQLQEVTVNVWRCPWTRDRRQVFVDGIMACGWPRGEKPPAEVA